MFNWYFKFLMPAEPDAMWQEDPGYSKILRSGLFFLYNVPGVLAFLLGLLAAVRLAVLLASPTTGGIDLGVPALGLALNVVGIGGESSGSGPGGASAGPAAGADGNGRDGYGPTCPCSHSSLRCSSSPPRPQPVAAGGCPPLRRSRASVPGRQQRAAQRPAMAVVD